MKRWQVALIGLILSTIMIQLSSVNGQNCYINNFNNSTEDLKNCTNPANVKKIVLTVTKLENIPRDVINRTQSVESIDVSNTSLQSMKQLDLCQWKKLTSIDADDNNITKLQSDIFDDCTQLNTLSLARNNMSQVYEQAFVGLSQLRELNLSSNQIKLLSEGTFNPLANLQTLRLNNNTIKTIKSNHFTNTSKLQVLDLSFNAIDEIESHAFEPLKELLTLNIQCNPSLKSLDLNGMDKLETLNAFNASLTQLDIPKNVKTVNADNNKIMTVAVPPNSMLEHLSLKNNSFQNISNLSSAPQLKVLDISRNNISHIDFAVLAKTNVENITVLENPIKSFNVTSLVALPKLKMIEISTAQLDQKILNDLLAQTKSKGIQVMDFNQTSGTKYVVTMPPATPGAPKIAVTAHPPVVAGVSPTTKSPSTTPSTVTKPPPPSPPKPASNSSSNATVDLNELMKRIQKLELQTDQAKKDSTNENADIEQSLSSLRFWVNCMIFGILAFVTFKIVIYLRANHWSLSQIFSQTPHVPMNNGRNPFNDSMDPIVDERL